MNSNVKEEKYRKIKPSDGFLEKYNIKSIAMPKLGCGLGGLDWNTVFREICKFHSEIPEEISNDLLIEIYL